MSFVKDSMKTLFSQWADMPVAALTALGTLSYNVLKLESDVHGSVGDVVGSAAFSVGATAALGYGIGSKNSTMAVVGATSYAVTLGTDAAYAAFTGVYAPLVADVVSGALAGAYAFSRIR